MAIHHLTTLLTAADHRHPPSLPINHLLLALAALDTTTTRAAITNHRHKLHHFDTITFSSPFVNAAAMKNNPPQLPP
jgi:hypothetical protein